MEYYKNVQNIVADYALNPEMKKYMSVCDVNEKELLVWDPYRNWCTIFYRWDHPRKTHRVVGFSTYEARDVVQDMVWIKNTKLPFKTPQTGGDMFYIPFITNLSLKIPMDVVIKCVSTFLETPDVKSYEMFTLMMLAVNEKKFFSRAKQNLFKALENVSVDELLVYNGVEMKTVPGTLKDRQGFYKMYPTLVPPSKWYKVKSVQVPDLFHHMVYAGGWVHLAYNEVKNWLWFETTRRMSKIRTNIWTSESGIEAWTNDIKTELRAKKTCSQDIADMEDLFTIEELPKMLPPCASIRGHFPKDAERTKLVAILRKGGVSLPMVGSLLKGLNDKYPHSPMPCSLKRRWDYEAYYTKKYAPPSCEDMDCPFKQDKAKCAQLFDATWPGYNRNGKNVEHLWGPYSWIKWIISLRRYLAARRPPAQAPDASHSISDI